MSELDTIIASATPAGRGALALVRIDGPEAPALAAELTRGRALPERQAVLTAVFDGVERIDDAIVVRYAAPRSFTGNDLIELSLHGNPFLVERLILAAIRRGARMAEPGEFTERAVLNGKLDLVQAEAIADLIASRTSLQMRLALGNLDGRLSDLAGSIRRTLLDVISRFEAALDFSDEGYEFIGKQEARGAIDATLKVIADIRETYDRGRATMSGLHVVLLGRPNAGKSTLLNFLCGSDRAIVTPIPGTTRDLLRETVEIGGLPVTLTDTAGLRGGGDAVEQIGIARAREEASRADFVLYLIDASEGLNESDRAELELLRDVLILYTKTDLASAPGDALGISVKEGVGLIGLLATLDRLVSERYVAIEGRGTIVNIRQRTAVDECQEALQCARTALQSGAHEEIVLVDLYRAANALGALTGAITHEEIMKEVFRNFCIGK